MLSSRTTSTGESFLLEQERGLGERQPPRQWNVTLGYMQALPYRVIPQALRPARAPRIYRYAGPVFEFFDRRTGVRLWTISGNPAQVLKQLMKQLNHAKMPISSIQFHRRVK